MDPELEAMYRVITRQLYDDGHKQLAIDVSNSLGMKPLPLPSVDMQMALNPIVSPIDNLTINGECGDYFPILSLPKHLIDLVFSFLPIEDRLAFAGVNNALNIIESESKYYVEELAIVEMPFIGARCSATIDLAKTYKHSIILFKNKTYSSDFIRRIAHNASIGNLYFELCGSSEFHREVCNLAQEIDIGHLELRFTDEEAICARIDEIMQGIEHVMLDRSAKLRHLYYNWSLAKEKYLSFLNLIGITYTNGTFFSNRDIEVYTLDSDEDDEEDHFNIFNGHLEM